MEKVVISVILLWVGFLAMQGQKRELSATLKEDYFREMASRENMDPEIRIIWYDSLLNVNTPDRLEILIKKITLLREAGYIEEARAHADKLIKDTRSLPLQYKLPLLFQRAAALQDSRNLMAALKECHAILKLPKPDSLKYWDVKTSLLLFNAYDDLGDRTRAKEWLSKMEAMLSSLPLSPAFRRDAEGRCHGSRATMLIKENNLDSAYKEVRIARELGTSPQTQMAALTQMAQICIMKGETQAARQYLEEALDIKLNDQKKRTAISMLAWCNLQEKKYADVLRVLASYPQHTIKVNSLGNTRAFYILRAQGAVEVGEMALAYNSLDSALVVGDTIIAKMTDYQRQNAEEYLAMSRKVERAESTSQHLKWWVIGLSTGILLLAVGVLPLLFRNINLRKRLARQEAEIAQARLDSHNSQMIVTKSHEQEEDMNRRQSALLLRLAHLDTILDSLKKKLSSDSLDKAERDGILKQLKEINGKEKMWETFSMQFDMTNQRFLDLLSERHPTLSKSEKRLCAFMLMNLSTKEIANLLDRSPRTIDVTKYNIRKKLAIEIPTEEYLRQLAAEAARSNYMPPHD